MSRWSMLAHAAEAQGGTWTPSQVHLAFDLLGTPVDFREGHKPGLALDLRGNVPENADDPAAGPGPGSSAVASASRPRPDLGEITRPRGAGMARPTRGLLADDRGVDETDLPTGQQEPPGETRRRDCSGTT